MNTANAAGHPDDSTLYLQDAGASPWGRRVLEAISFALAPGQILAVAGPNGAGKSSLLHLVAGDIQADAGSIMLNRKALADWSSGALARTLAYLPQMSLLNFPYTVEEVVLLGRIPHATGARADSAIAAQAMRLTDTLSLRERLYTQLSGGEKQRTQLARIFSQVEAGGSLAGKLLLLDEPTSALDLAHQQQILEGVQALADRGCAVILVIHELNLAARAADRMLILDGGRQIALGTPLEVLTQALLLKVFRIEVEIATHPLGGFPVITPGYRLRG